jgi:NitT/TauT family transport system substrate-binding protein
VYAFLKKNCRRKDMNKTVQKIKFVMLIIIVLILYFTSDSTKKTLPSMNTKDSTHKSGQSSQNKKEYTLNLALEFVDHAAAAHIALKKGWFKDEGITINACESYVTGMALSAALVRNDIDAAVLCLAPAICAYKNANVDLKVIAGTHLYGYGLAVDTKAVKTLKDLENPNIKIAAPRPGSPVDLFMNKLILEKNLNKDVILNKLLRMSPPKVLMALRTGKIQAGFCCEQFPSMAEDEGFKIIASAKDVWPGMQGSVLAVKQDLIDKSPELVEKLVKIIKKGLEYIHSNPDDACRLTALSLSAVSEHIFPKNPGFDLAALQIKPEVIKKSLFNQMECTPAIDPLQVQKSIDFMAELGYIEPFKAAEILDLRFLNSSF